MKLFRDRKLEPQADVEQVRRTADGHAQRCRRARR